jgi:hypothetical protein
VRLALLFASLLATFCTSPASGADLARAYFEATEPGSWARYETSTLGGGRNAATYTRLSNEGGGFVVEVATEFLEGAGVGGGSTSVFELAPEFDWKRRFLSFGKSLTGVTFVMKGRPPMPQPERMVAAMRESMADFTGGFEAVGTATHAGITCDVYTFQAVLGGRNPGTMSGELCLSAAVPFGLVHQTATMRNESGESAFETVLVDSGSGSPRAVPVPPAAQPAPPTAKRVDMALAYQRGVIALDFRVRENTGGRVLEVALTNLTEEPLVIGVGTTTYAFEVGLPIGTLFFQPVYDQQIALAPGQTSDEFHAGQPQGRGVREGDFKLVMKSGSPTLSGSMKVGKVK